MKEVTDSIKETCKTTLESTFINDFRSSPSHSNSPYADDSPPFLNRKKAVDTNQIERKGLKLSFSSIVMIPYFELWRSCESRQIS